MKKIIIISFTLLLSTNLQAQENLKFYIEKALKNNFKLKAERQSFESVKQSKNI